MSSPECDKRRRKKVNLTQEFDAQVWVKEWMKTIKKNPEMPYDEGFMLGWFAGAIMAGYDHARWEREKKAGALQKRIEKCIITTEEMSKRLYDRLFKKER